MSNPNTGQVADSHNQATLKANINSGVEEEDFNEEEEEEEIDEGTIKWPSRHLVYNTPIATIKANKCLIQSTTVRRR